jgi:hypothetical protein
MSTDIGEYIVGAYLQIIKGCDFVRYNLRISEGKLKGLNELDVLGLDLKNKTAYLCEVATHIEGLLYENTKKTIIKIKDKYNFQKEYAGKYLPQDFKKEYMFWSPVVSKGELTDAFNKNKEFKELTFVINENYTKCLNELREKAKKLSNDIGNPAFRLLQIIEHLK